MQNYGKRIIVDVNTGEEILEDVTENPDQRSDSEKATQYQRDRKPNYPPMQDYLDGIVKGDQAQIDKYISDCLPVKEKYPKGAN